MSAMGLCPMIHGMLFCMNMHSRLINISKIIIILIVLYMLNYFFNTKGKVAMSESCMLMKQTNAIQME